MNPETGQKKFYDLEERTFLFAKNICLFVKTLPYTIANQEDGKQVMKALTPLFPLDRGK
ncbi:MAG: hypothetical protein K9N09_03430 [Candidatus Cloacimonetes bacterium]|nr:hypothetical protein [Candidatus Cloacimonadota bacterium]MCF7813436.1 hypothetical protein [Candidatus Cloacimonadota bacterium]MCF7867729.1 hypothetical protein [Candidatus Cloacimonadota bacterium]MCF7883185.1 hypothetical protein [Candidatus Cloacimonadota bacterium]